MGAVRASCTGWPRAAGCVILPSPQHRGKGEHGREKAPRPRRAYRRVGAELPRCHRRARARGQGLDRVSVLENHSRAILASVVSPTQDLSAFLSVLYRAVERYGAPEALATDGGSVFRANQAKAVYEAAGIAKHEIEKGKPWQS